MNKSKISKTIGGLRIAMQALAERRGVALNIGGDQAFTDGKNITIPSLPEDDEEAMVLARGYIDHEAAHIAITDFDVPKSSRWHGILEDVRIERQQGEKYPGVAINTAKLLEAVVKKGGFAITKNPVLNLQIWAASRARTRIIRQQALAEREVVVEAMSRTAYGDPFCDEFAAIVDMVKDCRSTQDCAEVAEKLIQLLKTPPPPPPSPPEKQKGQKEKDESKSDEGEDEDSDTGDDDPSKSKSDKGDDEDGDAGDDDPSKSKSDTGDDEDGDADDDDPSKSKSDKGDDEDGDAGDGDPSPSKSDKGGDDDGDAGDGDPSKSKSDKGGDEDAGNGGGAGKDSPTRKKQLKNLQDLADIPDSTEDVTDLGAMLKEALEEKNQIAVEEGIYDEACVPKTMKKDSHISDFLARAFEMFKARLANESLKTAKMKTQLSGLFQAIGLKQKYPAMVGTRIDSRSIHLVAAQTPDTRVFLTRRDREMINTAIALMIDRSGSMDRDIGLAIQSAYVTSRSLESLPGTTHCIGLFPGNNEVWGSEIIQAKGFEERCRPEQFFNIGTDGGTPMAEAALWAGMMLTHRQETRRIAILFTDGAPDHEPSAKKAVDRLRRLGIEIYVVILNKVNSESPFDKTDNWIDQKSVTVISRIEQLPNALHGLLKDAFLKKRMVA